MTVLNGALIVAPVVTGFTVGNMTTPEPVFQHMEAIRAAMAHGLKFSVKHKLLEFQQVKADKYTVESLKYSGAWAEWIIAAKLYTAIKKIRFIKQID